LRPSWKMWPISMPRAISRAPPPAPRAGVAVADLGGLDGAVGGEVAARHEVEDVPPASFAPVIQLVPVDDPRVDQVADAADLSSPSAWDRCSP
jgi:hypothetical protein